jgi:hypothetical protein
MPSSSARRRCRADGGCGVTNSGKPGLVGPGKWCSSAHSQSLRAMLPLGRWWQHHRFRCHVGERLRPACGCGRGGWCRRSRRGRRAQLVIGESGFRLAGTVAQLSSVSVAKRSHAVLQRAWQHAQCAASPRGCRTFLVMCCDEVEGAGEALRGFRGASPEAHVVAM